MMARVRPARASERIWWRAAKAAISAKSMERPSKENDCRRSGRARQSRRGLAPVRGSVLPQVGQAAGDPPALAGGVVAPLLDVARLALDLGVAVHDPDFD